MNERMKRFRETQTKLGRKSRNFYMTDTEFDATKRFLNDLRKPDGQRRDWVDARPLTDAYYKSYHDKFLAKPIPEAIQPTPALVSNPIAEADPEPDIAEPENEHLTKLNQMALAFKAEGLCLDPEEEATIAQLAKTDPAMAVVRRAFAEDGARAYAKAMSKVEAKTEEIVPPTPEDQAELEALLSTLGQTQGGIFKGDGKIPKPLEEQLEDFFA